MANWLYYKGRTECLDTWELYLTPFLSYEIIKHSDTDYKAVLDSGDTQISFIGIYSTLEAAKAACENNLKSLVKLLVNKL